jgi:hypothetical protein
MTCVSWALRAAAWLAILLVVLVDGVVNGPQEAVVVVVDDFDSHGASSPDDLFLGDGVALRILGALEKKENKDV